MLAELRRAGLDVAHSSDKDFVLCRNVEHPLEGDPKDAPAPIEWPKGGWTIQPEIVMELPPHDVPAKGTLEWELIAFPAPFKGDTWVTSIELLPGEASVVHHICFNFEKHKPSTVYNRY